jgi:hypothetical protein
MTHLSAAVLGLLLAVVNAAPAHSEETLDTAVSKLEKKFERAVKAQDTGYSYKAYDDAACHGQNELGITRKSVKSCQAACDASPSCVSFEHRDWDNRCQLSSSCFEGSTAFTPDAQGTSWTLFVKGPNEGATPHYKERVGVACKGRNELGIFSGYSPATCAALCEAADGCISFEMSTGDKCQLSTSCRIGISDYNSGVGGWTLYSKDNHYVTPKPDYSHGGFTYGPNSPNGCRWNNCVPGGRYTGHYKFTTFVGSPAGCTGDYCDNYLPGGIFHHRCTAPRNSDDWGFAYAECWGTCEGRCSPSSHKIVDGHPEKDGQVCAGPNALGQSVLVDEGYDNEYCAVDNNDRVAGVRCCRDDNAGVLDRANAVCDENCERVTYETAVARCADKDASTSFGSWRLCTEQELLAGEDRFFKGCKYDYMYVWASDTCSMANTPAEFDPPAN